MGAASTKTSQVAPIAPAAAPERKEAEDMGIIETYEKWKDLEYQLENALSSGIFLCIVFDPRAQDSFLFTIGIMQGIGCTINWLFSICGKVKAGNQGSFGMIWLGHFLKCFQDGSMFVTYAIGTFTDAFPSGAGWGILALLGCGNTFCLWMLEIALCSTVAKASTALKEASASVSPA